MAGDYVQLYSDELAKIMFVESKIFNEPINVYNFEVEEWHTYFVSENNVLVHNVCKNPRLLSPQELNSVMKKALSGKNLHFQSKEQALDFIKKKFSKLKEEISGQRSANGWHFDEPHKEFNQEHINLYSKEDGIRIHITWED